MSQAQQRVIVSMVLPRLTAAATRALEERPLPPELGQRQFRRAKVESTGYNATDHTVTMAVSSEYPVQRYGGDEVLSHKPGAIQLDRLKAGIALLFNHDYNAHLGRSQSYDLSSGVLRITNKFGTNRLAREKEQDVADGILTDVSIGYQPLEFDITEDKAGWRTYTVTDWELYENSLVTVPADPTVGVDRAAPGTVHVKVNFRKLNDTDDPEDDDGEDDPEDDPAERTRSAADPVADPTPEPADAPLAAVSTSSAPTTSPEPEQRSSPMSAAAEVTDVKDVLAERNARQSALFTFRNLEPQHYPERDLQRDLASNETVAVIGERIQDSKIAAAQSTEVRSAAEQVVSGMSPREQRQYSRAGAARAAINILRKGTFDDKESGFAQEVSNSIRKEAETRGISGLGDGILTPGVTNVRFAAMEAQQRTVTSAGSSAGTATNFTEVITPPIELLRSKTCVLALGARMVPGLHGTPQFTRQNAAASSSWMAESQSVTSTDPGLDFFTMSPHRLSMASAYTRDFLALSNLAIDSFLSEDRNAVLARSLDYACLAGSGSNNVPLGLLFRTGLATVLLGTTRAANGTVTAGAGGTPPTYVDLNNMEAVISTANGDIGTMAWLGTPKLRASMRSIPQIPTASNGMVLMPGSKVGGNGVQEGPLGYNSLFSNQVPTNGSVNSVSNLHLLMLGVWDQLLIGDWDLSEIIADNITGAASATYKIFEHGYYDTNIRHMESFVAAWALAS